MRRRPTLRLACCALSAVATVLVTAPAASADPTHVPGCERPPAAGAASMHSPQLTLPHGRKLG
jgi:hypothetical protein